MTTHQFSKRWWTVKWSSWRRYEQKKNVHRIQFGCIGTQFWRSLRKHTRSKQCECLQSSLAQLGKLVKSYILWCPFCMIFLDFLVDGSLYNKNMFLLRIAPTLYQNLWFCEVGVDLGGSQNRPKPQKVRSGPSKKRYRENTWQNSDFSENLRTGKVIDK